MTDPKYPGQDQETPSLAGGMTREMKLLLGALMILLMASALAFYFNSLRPADAAVTENTSTVSTQAGTAANSQAETATNTQTAAQNTDAQATGAQVPGTQTSTVTAITTGVDGTAGTVSTAAAAPGTIPPLSSAPQEAGAGAGTTALGSINPDVPLAAVPARNPFRPLSLESDGSVPTGAVTTSAAPQPDAQPTLTSEFPEPSVALSAPSYSAPSYSAPSYSPPIASASRSSADTSSPGRTASASGAASPQASVGSSTTTWILGPDSTPVAVTGGNASGSRTSGSALSTTTGSTSTGSTTTGRAGSSAASRPQSSTSGNSVTWTLGPDNSPTAMTGAAGSGNTGTSNSATGNSGTSTGNSGAGSASTGTRPAPAPSASSDLAPWAFDNPDDYPEAVAPGTASRPAGASAPSTGPVAGVTEPGLSGATAASRAPTSAGAASAAAGQALSVPLPDPTQPDLITQYAGRGVGAPDSSTALSRTLNRQEVRFTGAVLGPTDTAIFRSSQGFMVLAQGERLPETEIVVQQITANSVTLALGQDSLKLELEPLQ